MTCESLNPMPQAAAFRRPPSEVMRLDRMGCSHPTRLSFLRQLLRRITAEGWRFDRPVWEMDARGVGRAVYRMTGPEGGSLSLVAFAHDLPADQRSDRVIATAWDATFALFDGTPDADDLDRLQANVPLQEAGRVSPRELSLSRANRSVRLFDHVVERLAAGQQPDAQMLRETGYLMRTTAVYGSGKFGAADRAMIAGRPALGPVSGRDAVGLAHPRLYRRSGRASGARPRRRPRRALRRICAGALAWAIPPASAWPRSSCGTRCCSTTG